MTRPPFDPALHPGQDPPRAAGQKPAGADPSTIRNALKPLQVIYRRSIDDGALAINPCERLRLPAARGRRERIASPTEAAALIAALGLEDRALWGCAFYAGSAEGSSERSSGATSTSPEA